MSTVLATSTMRKAATTSSRKDVITSTPLDVLHLLDNSPVLREFDRKVYEYCSRVPRGTVTTYKELAKAIGSPKAFRAVGSALRKNPFAPTVPCHRVVAADRSLGKLVVLLQNSLLKLN